MLMSTTSAMSSLLEEDGGFSFPYAIRLLAGGVSIALQLLVWEKGRWEHSIPSRGHSY
jgi:hypothetical protein